MEPEPIRVFEQVARRMDMIDDDDDDHDQTVAVSRFGVVFAEQRGRGAI